MVMYQHSELENDLTFLTPAKFLNLMKKTFLKRKEKECVPVHLVVPVVFHKIKLKEFDSLYRSIFRKCM